MCSEALSSSHTLPDPMKMPARPSTVKMSEAHALCLMSHPPTISKPEKGRCAELFGDLGTNNDRSDLATLIKTIASKAEVVATRICLERKMTLRECTARSVLRVQCKSLDRSTTLTCSVERHTPRQPSTSPALMPP